MTALAYFNMGPYLFIAGLPIFILICVGICRFIKKDIGILPIALASGCLFTFLFLFLLTDIGPFVGQKEIREYSMTWEVLSPSSNTTGESEVVLIFVDYPNSRIGFYSNELAQHLQGYGSEEVKVVFDVTLDYGAVRGFSANEIAGLKQWRPASSYSSVVSPVGSPDHSPWRLNGIETGSSG